MENTDVANNAKDNFISFILLAIALVSIIIVIVYLIYLSRLNNNECNFMNDTYGTIDGYLKSINPDDPDCSGNLRDYFIKTAYNCCNGGSYKNDFVNICNMKNVMKQGVRCLDFEIYSINDNPVVASSTSDSYNYKETFNKVDFSDVMTTIKNNAFSSGTVPNPEDPLILHLRFQTNNQKMYTNLANILSNYTDILLDKDYSYESGNKNPTAQPLTKFMNKVMIIVDRTNTSFAQNQDFIEFVNLTSNSAFMRIFNYKDVKDTPDIDELIKYNKRNMTIVIPDNTSNPENSSTPYCQSLGCQMVAMRYQYVDTYLEQNTAIFDRVGYAFSLKPFRLRYHPVYIDAPVPQNKELSYANRNARTDYYSFDY